MALRTPLYDWHRAHGGRMVDFAGWDMPVQYTSITDEHAAVRTAAGLFDISHMGRLSFAGADALGLIQQVYTNDAAAMQDGQVRYGLICNEHGGIRDDVLVYRWRGWAMGRDDPGQPLRRSNAVLHRWPYGWSMVVNASNREKIVAWLDQHRGGRDVQVQDQTLETGMIAVQGPRAVELCRGLTEADPAALRYYHATPTLYRGKLVAVSRTGYTGEDGVELMVGAGQAVELWEELVARGARPCGLGARDTLRLEAAMPLYGHELTEETDPYQAGLGWAVKPEKGDFIGRDAMLRRRDDPTLPRRVGLEIEGKRIAREGAAVLRDGREVGRVTSGTFSPTLGRVIAVAYVAPDVTAAGTVLAVDVRGQPAPARVVPLPFYRRPKAAG
jgi:aminomethyltransferase